MNDVIKEILDYLKIENGHIGSELSYEETHLLLDYITNLQQENEKIRKMNMHEHKYGSDMEEKYLIEKSRIEKAVEYIKQQDDYFNEYPLVSRKELLNILNIRSDE